MRQAEGQGPASAASRPASPAAALDQWSGDPAFMLSLARGLLVLQEVTSAQGEPILNAELCRRTGLSRAALRRCLYTLEALGHVRTESGAALSGPRFGAMATAYVSSQPILHAYRPVIRALRDRIGQSVAFGVFEHGKPTPIDAAYRDDPIQIGVTARDPIPLYCTAIGRVLLASMAPEAALAAVKGEALTARTDRTITSLSGVMDKVEETRRLGYSLIDQETLPSLRSIAVGVEDSRGDTVAWLSVTVHTSMLNLKDLKVRIAAEMMRSAQELSRQIP